MTLENSISMRPIRAGVIGLGVGEAHIRSYQATAGVEVVGICDIDPQRLAEIGQRYDIALRSTDYRTITEHPDIDVVSICSYDDAHAAQLISAFMNGKHAMVEKPCVLYRHEAEQVLRAMTDNRRLITSNLILRRSPRFQAVKAMIASGAFGDIFHIEGDYLHQILWKITEGWRGKMPFYCTVYGGGIHLIDLMRWLMNQEVTQVSAMGTDLLTKGTTYHWPDTITVLMKYQSGATGKSTTTLGPQRTKFHSLNVYGTKQTFVNDMPDAKLFTGDDPAVDVKPMTVPYPAMEKGDLLPDFIDCIRRDTQPLIGAVDIFRVMDVCFAAWEAVQQQKTVNVNYLL